MNGLLSILILLLLALSVGCSASGHSAVHDGPSIADLRLLPQDATAYIDLATADEPVLSAPQQARLAGEFKKAWYAPWALSQPIHDAAAARARLEEYRSAPAYGGNCRLHPPQWFARWADEMNLAAFPAAGCPALTLRNTVLRKLPTTEPLFLGTDPTEDYYPFDELQVSAIWGNTPVYVSHFSRDGAWALVETPYMWGWVPSEDLARVDQGLMDRWQRLPLLALVADNVPVRDKNGRLLFRTHVGAVLPLEGRAGADAGPLAADAVAPASGSPLASARSVPVAIPAGSAVEIPLPATPANLARQANRLLGQTYAWGGLNEDRDCSSTLRDFFTPFGLFLPRNSADQYLAGRVVDMSALAPVQKEQKLLAEGAAWLTLVYARGHIMLYVGRRDGRAIIFHNFWAVRTRRSHPQAPRRHVVGQCVLTTLQPGRELPDWDPQGDLLNRIDAFTLLNPVR
ncbi:MAG: hypothetical protein BWX88_03917 [Planctomycetes bacterium ADurb.Bin126]|nr:MAG: hypothetical protein BWX88_03917 [Planctomycetes bacterium ADurb.Bin126]HOD81434.1 NlpC/P60 family N-terminal domain-containing protein [Phycisphaerae bacterium]HQL75903.1 NlpC/P60 family N-terminal domain-containing protein [Phycisphaerae bacterium]